MAKKVDEGRKYRGTTAHGGVPPRLRRCTVEQVFSMLGGSGDDFYIDDDGEVARAPSSNARELLEAAELGAAGARLEAA